MLETYVKKNAYNYNYVNKNIEYSLRTVRYCLDHFYNELAISARGYKNVFEQNQMIILYNGLYLGDIILCINYDEDDVKYDHGLRLQYLKKSWFVVIDVIDDYEM